MYTKANVGAASTSINAGDIVQLSDKENEGIFSMTEMCNVTSGESLHAGPKPEHRGYFNKGIDADGGYRQEALSYWQVYSFANPSYGGAIQYKEPIALRHLVSGRYLKLDSHKVKAEGGDDDQQPEPSFAEVFDPSNVQRSLPFY